MNSTAKNIRRVSQPVIFDLREGSDAGSIRMVSQVEFFNIASDDENEYDDYMVNTVVETDNEEVNLELYEEGGERQSFKVIVDSGADASIFPGKFLESTLSSKGKHGQQWLWMEEERGILGRVASRHQVSESPIHSWSR